MSIATPDRAAHASLVPPFIQPRQILPTAHAQAFQRQRQCTVLNDENLHANTVGDLNATSILRRVHAETTLPIQTFEEASNL